jgi:hypothetical protein
MASPTLRRESSRLSIPDGTFIQIRAKHKEDEEAPSDLMSQLLFNRRAMQAKSSAKKLCAFELLDNIELVESCKDEAQWSEEVKVALREECKAERTVKRGPV